MRHALKRLRLQVAATSDWVDQTQRGLRHTRRGLAHAKGRVTASSVERAIAGGVRFLHTHQRSNGIWKGFLLPPGAATTWLTAHVAFVVEDVAELEGECFRAAE